MRTTLAQAKPIVARVLGLCSTDGRIVDYIVRADERLLYKLKSVGTFSRYRVCVNESCITWPPELETIEAFAICLNPGVIRNGWFEFLGEGPGVLGSCSDIGLQLLDRGNSVLFDQITGTGKKIAIYCDGSEDTSKRIVLKYKDNSGQKLYTDNGAGITAEGDSIALPAIGQYAYSTRTVYPGGLYDVIKPVTKYPVRLYQFTPATSTFKPIAYYEPQDTVPSYRSSFVGNLATLSEGCTAGVALDVMGKRRFRPAAHDTDVLCISNVEAIRLACQAIDKEEKNLQTEAMMYWSLATQALNEQLHHWNGDGVVQPIRLVQPETGTAAVGNLV